MCRMLLIINLILAYNKLTSFQCFIKMCSSPFMIMYSTAQLVFQNPPRTGGVDFLAHCGSCRYPTPIPIAADFSSTEFPLSSLRNTTHLPVEVCGGQKFILASWQWKISDVRMIDSSEFSKFAWGGNRSLYFCLRIIRLICCWINTKIFLPTPRD